MALHRSVTFEGPGGEPYEISSALDGRGERIDARLAAWLVRSSLLESPAPSRPDVEVLLELLGTSPQREADLSYQALVLQLARKLETDLAGIVVRRLLLERPSTEVDGEPEPIDLGDLVQEQAPRR